MDSYRCSETKVFIENLRLALHVGAGSQERNAKQTVVINITLDIKNSEVVKDDLSLTVDYSDLTKQIRVLSSNRSKRRLLETLASEIADICLANSLISRVSITIRKLNKLPDTDAVGVTRVFEAKKGDRV